MTAHVRGLKETLGTLQHLADEFPEAVREALWQEAQLVMNDSQKQVPVDQGRLRSSGRVDTPLTDGARIVVTMGYYTEYAAAVHENLNAHHKAPTKAKYLEDPANARAPKLPENLVKRTRRILA